MKSIIGPILALGVAGFAIQATAIPIFSAQAPASQQRPIAPPVTPAIQDGTPLRLRIKRTVSSSDSNVGETVNFEVLDEIRIGDVVMIPRGGEARGTITEAVSRQNMGRRGELSVVVDYARLITGDKVPLRATKESQIGDRVSAPNEAIAIAAPSIGFFPAAPFLLFVHGKDVTLLKGTEVTAFVNGDYTVDPAKFRFTTTGRPPQTSATGILTNEDISAFRQAGLSNEVILARIKASKGSYKTNADDISALWKVGVSDGVILAMIEAASR